MSLTLARRFGPASMVAAALSLSLAGSGLAQTRTRMELPDGAVVPVVLNTPLSSRTSQPGDRFTATVKYGRDDAGMPRGTRIEGVVREALPAHGDKPGVLDLDFRRVVFPDGNGASMDASLVSMDNKSVRRSSSGYLVASHDKSKDRLKFIGIGAAGGLIIGALTKQNTIASVLLGAGAGYLYNEFGNKPKPGDVNLKAGSEFGVRLERQLAYMGDRQFHRSPLDAQEERPVRDDPYFRGGDNYQRLDRESPVAGDRVRNTAPAPDVRDIGVMIDDRNVSFGNVRPFMAGGVPMIPLRALAQAGQFDYDYQSSSRMIRARHGDIRLAVGSRIAIVNGQRRRLENGAEVRNGTVFVPMQFAAMALNGSASWDAPSRTVVITTRERLR